METKNKKPKVKIMGTSKKVSTSDLEQKVKAKADIAKDEGEIKKKKSKEPKGEATQRASNYKFPKDADVKDRKKFRTSARKINQKFADRYAEAKSGKSKEKSGTVRKEWDAWKAETYLNPEEVGAEAE
jgi:hypothetical protein